MRSHPLLRFTRRGMIFMAADPGAPAGGGGAPGKTAEQLAAEQAAASAQPLDYKALLLALLSLPAEATDAEISAKEAEIRGTLGTVGDLQTQASSAQELQTKLDGLQSEYDALNAKQTELYRQKQEADADEILKVYEGHFVDDASKAAIRNILLTDKDAGIAILNGLKKPEVAAAAAAVDPSKATPPPPKHDPNAPVVKTDAEKVAEQNALITKIQGEGKFKDYSAAREEARRQKPELFS